MEETFARLTGLAQTVGGEVSTEALLAVLDTLLESFHAQQGTSTQELLLQTRPHHVSLVRLVQQPSPLISFAAGEVVKCLLRSRYLGAHDASMWIASLLDWPDDAPQGSVVNALECCRGIVASWGEERHPELLLSPDDGTFDTGEGPPPEVVCHAAIAVCHAIPRLIGWAMQQVTDGDQLAIIWVIKVLAVLSNQQAAGEYVSVESRLAAWGSVLRGWGELRGLHEARRQVLMLALDLLRNPGFSSPSSESSPSPYHAVSLLQALRPIFEEADEESLRSASHGGSGEPAATSCSFIRATTPRDLVPYLIALFCKAFAINLDLPESALKLSLSEAFWSCPLCQAFLRTAPDHSSMIQVLADHDDLLIEALNDWLLVTGRTTAAAGTLNEHWHSYLLKEAAPLSMLAAFISTLAGDEQVLLDMLLSSETCILEYLIRVTKYITVFLTNGDDKSVTIEEDVSAGIECILRLGLKVEGLSSRGHFPYDARPWLKRVAECRAVYAELLVETAEVDHDDR